MITMDADPLERRFNDPSWPTEVVAISASDAEPH